MGKKARKNKKLNRKKRKEKRDIDLKKNKGGSGKIVIQEKAPQGAPAGKAKEAQNEVVGRVVQPKTLGALFRKKRGRPAMRG